MFICVFSDVAIAASSGLVVDYGTGGRLAACPTSCHIREFILMSLHKLFRSNDPQLRQTQTLRLR
ncbi:hypothetical protein, partial [Chromobacterium violaceum]|uniref:hypothetical protein n=1 Tax=Chromobacterium violaceum TaxID=536 RepID=UPI001A95EBF5